MQCEGKFAVKQLGADPEIALCIWHQYFIEPLLVFFDGCRRNLHHRFETRAQRRGDVVEFRPDHVVHDRNYAAVLPGCGFSIDQGNPSRVQNLANLLEKTRHRFEPGGCTGQALVDRRKFAREQGINGTSCDLGITDRVPGPFLQLLLRPQAGLDVVMHQFVVDLVGPGEILKADFLDLILVAVIEGRTLVQAFPVDFIQQVIIAVVAQDSRCNRRQRWELVDITGSQSLEFVIGFSR